MSDQEIQELTEYYRSQGAPQDQQMLIALMRELQEACGGVLTPDVIEAIAAAYGMKSSMLQALIRRVPSLRLASAAHRLEVCSTCKMGARLRDYIERTYGVKSGAINEAAGFSYHLTPCMKNCKNGPSIRFDGQLYSHADEALIRKLLGK